MNRKRIAIAMGMLLLLSLFSGAAGEGPDPATPSDLDCLHEHTKTTIYFYDTPAYTPVSANAHRVSGPATIQTVCLDCGAVLSTATEDNAEEIRPHSMKKGVCVLCGYRMRNMPEKERPADEPGEMTIFAPEDERTGLLALTLTSEDMTALENAGITTALVRGETGDAAVALGVAETRSQIERAGADLYLQMAERDDGSFFTALHLVTGDGAQTKPADEGITLRFYRQNLSNVRVQLAPTDEDTLIEAESEWNEKGYWTVSYIEEGTYFLLQ